MVKENKEEKSGFMWLLKFSIQKMSKKPSHAIKDDAAII